MKIRQDQLEDNLQRPLALVYTISGDEPLMVSECADLVRKKAKMQGYSERIVYHIHSGFDWREFIETANELSLFSDKKMIELRIPNGKVDDAGKKALLAYLSSPSSDNLLLLITGRIEGQTQKSKWFRVLESKGIFLPIWPVEAKQLPSWISHRFKVDSFKISTDALMLLAERVEGNLLAAFQEIEKLKLLSTDHNIDVDNVRGSVSNSARYDVFNLSDAALEGDTKSCIRILRGLKGEGVEASIVLWALSREIRLLSYLSRQLSKNNSFDTALSQSAKVIGFSPYLLKRRQPIIKKAIYRHSEKRLRSLLIQAGQVDSEIKGIGSNNPWNSLQDLLLSLAGMPTIVRQ